MKRTYTAVMLDIARLHDGTSEHSIFPKDDWTGIIIELADLDDERYAAALRDLRKLVRIADMGTRYVREAV